MIFFKALKALKVLNDLCRSEQKRPSTTKVESLSLCVNCILYETILAAAG